jgi:agmatine/peptidylarginine deiminase
MKQTFDIKLPAEWAPQDAVMLTWPHVATDWKDNLDEVIPCFVSIAKEILQQENLLIVCPSAEEVKQALGEADYSRISFREMPTNDTWARDHGPISIFVNEIPYLLDFTFNGWGLKFPANHDNQITRKLYESKAFSPETNYQSMLQMVLEGGSIESDGEGTLLTTTQCLLSENRNEYKSKAEIADYLGMIFGVQRVLWLNHGYLAGDDTDSHVDTLARFCDKNTIAYVQCADESDAHFAELSLMEKELQKFCTSEGAPYRLIPLPMADPVYFDDERLPATYANFLIINGAVLLPFYDSPLDEMARKKLQEAFPDREIIGIDCRPLIKQHGSLHCVTMQIPTPKSPKGDFAAQRFSGDYKK